MKTTLKALCGAIIFSSPVLPLCYAGDPQSPDTQEPASGEEHHSAGESMKSGFHELDEGFKEGASETGNAFKAFGKEVGGGFKEGGKEFKDSYEK